MFVLRSCWRAAAVALACASLAAAAPALSTIQDILYRADGSRFNGSLSITWTGFQAGDDTPVPTHGITVNVINGILKVQLIPTTNGSAGASYTVNYSSQGKYVYTETWAVPPTTGVLHLRDVRIGAGAVIGPTGPPVLTQLNISDVTGLSNELTARPMRGVGFAPSRAATINSAGQLDSASGNLGDCIHVDGTSGPCGGGGGAVGFVDAEVPAGLVNGTNPNFTLNFAPSPPSSLAFYRNGILMKAGADYLLTGSAVAFYTASIPQAGDLLLASYRYADPNNPLSSAASPQTICSSTGQATSSAFAATLGTCSFPASFLAPGDRVEIRFDVAHQGNSSGFVATASWGTSTMLARSGSAAETVLSGKIDAAVYGSGAQWSAQSWGTATSMATAAGAASDSIASAITVTFSGQLTSASSDTVSLRNFTVIRYPAQSHP
jgi:hypothetical protein